jgi:hypothetical protein
MLVSLVSSYRYGGVHVDEDVAKLDASRLSEAMRKKEPHRDEVIRILSEAMRKKEPHRDEVIRIVSTRSKAQLRATFQCYRDDHGTDFVEVQSTYSEMDNIHEQGRPADKHGGNIKREIILPYWIFFQDIDSHCSSQFAKTLKIAVWCLTSPEKHFAEVIRHSIVLVELGMYEDMLTRAIVSRAEIDMRQIKAEYRARFKTTVTRDVVHDTSFGYRDLLLALVGDEEEGVEISNERRCIPC